MTRITFKTQGFAELEKALAEELPKATAKAVLRRAGIAAMGRIEERARQLVPVDEGRLRDGIVSKPVRAQRISATRFARASGVEIATGPTGRHGGGVGAFQEFGTVNMPANPFMRPAVDQEAEAVINDVRDELALQIGKAKTRIARKAARQAGG